jgi:hypothetical protein
MNERGAIVVGWLTKIVVALAIVAVAGFDAVAIGASHVTLTDDANAAAEAANLAWNESHGNVQSAYDAAYAFAVQHNEQAPIQDFSVEKDGTVRLVLTKTTTTLVVHRIGPLKKYTKVSQPGSATSPQQ